MSAAVTYRVIGNSDYTQCDQCGKSNLKRTVHLENLQTGGTVFFGVDCAATVLRQRYMGKTSRVSREAIKNMANRARREPVILEAAPTPWVIVLYPGQDEQTEYAAFSSFAEAAKALKQLPEPADIMRRRDGVLTTEF